MKATLTTLTLSLAATAVFAGVQDRPYDFNDAYYRANGIEPTLLSGRIVAPSTRAVIDTPLFYFQRNVRVIGTAGGYGASGEVRFFAPLANFASNAFTSNSAGQRAKQIVEQYAEYVFPQRGNDPIGFGNTRQSGVLDTSNGFFSNNPLGLWIRVWVNYTDRAFNTSDGKKMLADLAQKNGIAKDGTPIIRNKSEIENLYSKGFVTKLTRNDTLRYSVCPVLKDPRDGGIAPDATFNPSRRLDGTLLEPWIYSAFQSLQKTGDWPNS